MAGAASKKLLLAQTVAAAAWGSGKILTSTIDRIFF
jgi:hypothetical protein